MSSSHVRTSRVLLMGITVMTAMASAVCAQVAPSAPTTPPTKKTLKFLTPSEVDPGRLLPPPPKDGSENQVREMAEVKRLIKERTPERHAQAVWDDAHEDISAFAATIGPGFDLNKLPATAKLFADVQNDENIANITAKAFFHRKFPVAAESAVNYRDWSCEADVNPPGDRPLRSYPSGHATMGYSFGIILAALIPEKSQAILARAADYAYSREVCGDHYHADIEASHALGTATGLMLLNNAALKPEIEAARAELRAAHLTER
jgi:acid phosphatase (class A)